MLAHSSFILSSQLKPWFVGSSDPVHSLEITWLSYFICRTICTSAVLSPNFCIFPPGGRSTTFLAHGAVNQSVISTWLRNDPTKDRMEITNLFSNPTLSVNSLDVFGSCLVYGTDAECIYVKKNLFA